MLTLLVLAGLPRASGAEEQADKASAPAIASVSPTAVQWSDVVTVTGSGFGSERGSVSVGDIVAKSVLSWSASEVSFQVPSGVPAGANPVVVSSASGAVVAASDTLQVRNYLLPRSGSFAPGIVRVRLRLGATPVALARRWGVGLPEMTYPEVEIGSVLRRYYDIEVAEGQEADFIARVAGDEDVEWAQPEYVGGPADAVPNDTYYGTGTQWAPQKVEASLAWAYSKGSGATIGIIDSGVNPSHPDLAGKVLSRDVLTDETGTFPADGCGHGTHVAGIAAAATDNARGVAGLGWFAGIRSYKVIRGNCEVPISLFASWVVSAIGRARAHGVKVINMSLRFDDGEPCTPDMQTALDQAAAAGILSVASAGNDGNSTTQGLTACNNVFTVASVDITDTKASDSAYGTWVDLAAPGVNLYSTAVTNAPQCGAVGSAYAYCSGTSMAAPMVAGTAALLYAGGANRAQVISYLTSMATQLTTGVCGQGLCGAGRLNAARSLNAQEYAHIASNYTYLGCCLAGDPDPASWASGHVDIYMRGTDNQLYHKFLAPTGFTDWIPQGNPPGGLASDPGVAAWAAGRMDVFGRGLDGRLWQTFYTGAWSSWFPLDAPLGGLTSGPDVASWGFGRLDIVANGTGGKVWHKFHDGGWGGWYDLGSPPGGAGSDPSITAWSAGRLDVFVRGAADGALWHKWYDGTWSGWENLGGGLVGAPDATSWAPMRLDIFVRGTDNSLYRKWFDGTDWSHWDPWGPTLGSGPGAIDLTWGRLDVFIRGTDGAMYHKTRNP